MTQLEKFQIFTYTGHDDGKEYVFTIHKMYEDALIFWSHNQRIGVCGPHPIEFMSVMNTQEDVDMIIRVRDVDMTYVNGLVRQFKNGSRDIHDPVLMVAWRDGGCVSVDGNHRIVARWHAGLHNYPAFIFMPGQWDKYLL